MDNNVVKIVLDEIFGELQIGDRNLDFISAEEAREFSIPYAGKISTLTEN